MAGGSMMVSMLLYHFSHVKLYFRLGFDMEVESITISDDEDETNSSIEVSNTSRRRSAVWAFFSLKNASEKNWVNCDICQSTVKTKDSSTTNLFNHLKYNHPVRYAQIKDHRRSISTDSASMASTSTSKSCSQPTITSAFEATSKYRDDSDRAMEITQSLTRYITSGW